MNRLSCIIFFLILLVFEGRTQYISVNDLINLSSVAPKNTDNYLNKKGFQRARKSTQDEIPITHFSQKRTPKDSLLISQTIEIYKNKDSYFIALHTNSLDEYLRGWKALKESGFFYDKKKDSLGATSLLFQQKNLTVMADSKMEDSTVEYTFLLQKKDLPGQGSIQFAEDLLKFDSHEYLVSYFGEKNVKRDVYYFSENELKKCSILFSNSGRQAIFVWEDEANFRKLSYVLISGILPALSAEKYSGNVGQNKWVLKNGVYSGMSLKELLRLNGSDFEFFDRNSEFSYMVVPQRTGNIDFKKTGIMLGCLDCNGYLQFKNSRVSASDAVQKGLSLYIFYIMVSK